MHLDGYIARLIHDDYGTFHCHKTVHNERTGEQCDGAENYHVSGEESMCAGAMISLEKVGRPTVGMRIARLSGFYDPDRLRGRFDEIIAPPDGPDLRSLNLNEDDVA